MKKKTRGNKGKLLGFFSSLSGGLSVLGSWQVCHSLCLSFIALLSVLGIAIAGMPLLFLNQYATYFWSAAFLLLMPILIMYWKNRRCMSVKLILFNIGVVIASIPFAQAQPYQIIFFVVGGAFVASSAWMFLKSRFG